MKFWQCKGEDRRILPEAVLALGTDALKDTELLEDAMNIITGGDSLKVKTLPLMQNIESVALGAIPKQIGKVYSIRDYRYRKISDISIEKGSLVRTPEIQSILKYVKRHSGEKMILEIEGPFSVLSGMIDPMKLFVAARKHGEELQNLLFDVADELAEYIKLASQAGIKVFSLAEPEGSMDVIGEKYYQEFVGKSMLYFISKIKPYMNRSIVHMCGKSSSALEMEHMASVSKYAVEEKPYKDILFRLSSDPDFRFVGNACINRKYLETPIVNKLNFVKYPFTKEEERRRAS